MVRILLHGCCGRMGHMIAEMAAKDEGVSIAAGVDARGEQYADFPVYHSLEEVKEEADVCIDFSTAAAVPALLEWCQETKTPVIVCTTGLSVEQIEELHAVSDQVAVLKSANMSVGINLIEQILKEAAPKLLAAGFDCEIVEKHHNQKLDAPRAARRLPSRMRSMSLQAGTTSTFLTALQGGRSARRRRSASPLSAPAPSLATMT